MAPNTPENVLIAVMGAVGSGKTTFINLASGANLRIGNGLRTCTNDVQVASPFELDGRSVTLIDTPGFDGTAKSDTDVLTMIASYLKRTYQQGTKLTGIIYMHRISDLRMGGVSFRNFKMFRQLCGEATLKNVVLVTNMWGQVSPQVGAARETELANDFFKPVLDKGARLLRHDNTLSGAQAILGHVLQNHPLPLHIQCELADKTKDITETAAGAELSRALDEQREKHRQEKRQLRENMNGALQQKDEEKQRGLDAVSGRFRAEIARARAEARNLASVYSSGKASLQQQMSNMAKAAERENGRLISEYKQRVQTLEQSLQQMRIANDHEKAVLTNRLHQLQRS